MPAKTPSSAETRLHPPLAPQDFHVEELLRAEPSGSGDFAVYRLTKHLLTTPEAQEQVARILHAPPSALAFPALKDKAAVTVQHFSFRGRGPNRIEGQRLTADFLGRAGRHVQAGDLAGNRFTVTLRGAFWQRLPVSERLASLALHGLPNYFDEQRFGSYTPGGAFFGKAVLQSNAEAALRIYLTQPSSGDSAPVVAFKQFAGAHWKDWPNLFEKAPKSNYRSVLTFLKDHPEDFRRALNLITPRLLPLLLEAYQSFLWNRIASAVLGQKVSASEVVNGLRIAGERLTSYRSLPPSDRDMLLGMRVPMPYHRAVFPHGAKEIADEILAQEGLGLHDLKARLLKRAYLTRSVRPLILVPKECAATTERDGATRVSFILPPGSYGTLVLKLLSA